MFWQFQISGLGGGGHYKTHHVVEQLSALMTRLHEWSEPGGRAPSHRDWGVLALRSE